MRTNIGNVPLEKELLKERNWSKHLEYTENLWRKDIQGLNISDPVIAKMTVTFHRHGRCMAKMTFIFDQSDCYGRK